MCVVLFTSEMKDNV